MRRAAHDIAYVCTYVLMGAKGRESCAMAYETMAAQPKDKKRKAKEEERESVCVCEKERVRSERPHLYF